MLQVHKSGIRIVNIKNETNDLNFGEAAIECVDFSEPFGLVCLNDKNLKLLEFKSMVTCETKDCDLVDKDVYNNMAENWLKTQNISKN